LLAKAKDNVTTFKTGAILRVKNVADMPAQRLARVANLRVIAPKQKAVTKLKRPVIAAKVKSFRAVNQAIPKLRMHLKIMFCHLPGSLQGSAQLKPHRPP
jgi:hypothetical protein